MIIKGYGSGPRNSSVFLECGEEWAGRNSGMPPYHLSKDTAQAPDVHSCGIIFAAQKNFRCSVPQGYHLGTKVGRGGMVYGTWRFPHLSSPTLL